MGTGDLLFSVVPILIVLLPFALRYRRLRRSWWPSLLIGLPCLWAYAYLLYRLDSTGSFQLSGYGLPVFLTHVAIYSAFAGLVVIVYSAQPRGPTANKPLEADKREEK